MSATLPPEQPLVNPANPSLLLLLHEVEDTRLDRAKKHALPNIFFLSLCGVIYGCESFNDIEDFGHAKHDWLQGHIELANGIPSHDTINRVFQILAPRTFQECNKEKGQEKGSGVTFQHFTQRSKLSDSCRVFAGHND